MLAQSKTVCSNGSVSFDQYEPIMYPYFLRRAGQAWDHESVLKILPDGSFTYLMQDDIPDPTTPKPDMFGEMRQSIKDAMKAWHFSNDTNQTLYLRLRVAFRISGLVRQEDNKVINQIIFNKEEIIIKVIASQVTPLVE